MILQADDFSCGPCAVVNALEAMGRRVTKQHAVDLAETTFRSGTSETHVIAALAALGHDSAPIDRETLYRGVISSVVSGSAVILYDPSRDHWLAVVGACGDRAIAYDSLVGVIVLDSSSLVELASPDLYALSVTALGV